MAITSELIGKLGGGAGVEVIPVSATASGEMGSEAVMHTVKVPAGETWLVAMYGNLKSDGSGNDLAGQLAIGTTVMPRNAVNGSHGLAHVGTGTINVKLRRNTLFNSDTFTGHVYTVKL